MAGEMLAQIIDLDAYARLRPALDDLDKGGVLAPSTLERARDALSRVKTLPELDDSGLERIIALPGVAPRHFLSPDALDDASRALLYALAFYKRDGWPSAQRGGANWVLIEPAILAFSDHPVLSDAFIHISAGWARSLEHPKRGEARLSLLERDRIKTVISALEQMAAVARGRALEELQALAAVLRRAAATPGASLVFQFML